MPNDLTGMGKIPTDGPVFMPDSDRSGTAMPEDIDALIRHLNDKCPNGEDDFLVIINGAPE